MAVVSLQLENELYLRACRRFVSDASHCTRAASGESRSACSIEVALNWLRRT